MITVKIDPPTWRPVHITLTTEDDFDKLIAVIAQVADNRIHHPPM